MALAWGTIVILVLLIPGFLFFFGFYAPERMSRETAPTSALGQLAGIVIVAFLVHALSYALFARACYWSLGLPCINVRPLLATLRLEADPVTAFPGHMTSVAATLEQWRWWILGYFTITGTIGCGMGWVIGALVVKQIKPFAWLATHPWMYPLMQAKKGLEIVEAVVLTTTMHDKWAVMYRGSVKDFYAAADGTIKQLVLKYPNRFQMRLGDIQIPAHAFTTALPLGGKKWQLENIIIITGEHVVNIYLQPSKQIPIKKKGLDYLEREVKKLHGDARQPKSSEPGKRSGLALLVFAWVHRVRKLISPDP